MIKRYLLILVVASLLIFQTSTVEASNQKPKETTIPILMYHYIRDYYNINDPLGINLSVSPKNFKAQLDCLKQLGYTPITFQDIIDKKLPAKPIILTFDDGYEDFYLNAYPELKKHNFKAVTYIIAATINAPRYLSFKQLQEMSNNNIEIGDHTWSHPDLRNLDAKKLTWEITVSKNYLTNLFKKPIISFAYPSGKYNEQAIAEVKKAGYNYAVTTNLGLANLANNLVLNRLRIFNKTNLKIVLKK